ncbi:hypothetical protein [Archaeoglobus sp.]|uniref:hypothetical protein n=1 Tax=Archaeoglobus sp. TaxID=1872626 RepID=UPI0024AC5327|nr:hypothetical protein [Archaeoglobus sp.]MDI3498953.1 hypothetical protein [Archaeoglobus sp.]
MMSPKLKSFLIGLVIVGIFFAASSVLFFLALLNEFNNIPSHLMFTVESDSWIENVTLLFPVYTYLNQSIEFSECIGAECNISVVETDYGGMWRIEMSKIGRMLGQEVGVSRKIGGTVVLAQPFIPNRPPIDLFSINIHPALRVEENYSENGRYYTKTASITVPVCVNYDGNTTTVKVKLLVQSGLNNILGLIPASPKHDGRVYTGTREDVFKVDFKGCGNVTGISRISIVYQ